MKMKMKMKRKDRGILLKRSSGSSRERAKTISLQKSDSFLFQTAAHSEVQIIEAGNVAQDREEQHMPVE